MIRRGAALQIQIELLIALLVLLSGPSGCKPEPGSSRAAADAGAERPPPPPIRVSADRSDLVFSYLGPQGFVTATRVDDVPAEQRRQVIVTDLSLSPAERQADRYVYIADLRSPREDGTYPVAVASRYGFEAKLAGTGGSTIAGGSTGGVVVYTTSWCGVCKRAKQLLRSLSVPFVEKDIEASRQAASELEAKAARAGIQPGGVPVIDVAGTLLQGLDEATLRSVLAEKGLLR